ncbi:Cytochrome c [Spirosomataceae bacterium TFI 002]|nr:Cytochrome c [Spirosomataceae bacterium TFI 002]
MELQIKPICLLLLTMLIYCCQSGNVSDYGRTINEEAVFVDNGKVIFEQKCSHCHNFKQDAIGPNLSGITKDVETQWIKEFIKNPFKMVAENDVRAKALHQQYKIYMPGFDDLAEEELNALISYLHTYQKKESRDTSYLANAVDNPIKDTLFNSKLKANLEFVAQVPPSEKTAILARINKLECAGNSGRIFINDLRGMLYELKGHTVELYASIPNLNKKFIHKPGLGTGFGSFAFHPDFAENGLFYTAHSETKKEHNADFFLSDSIPVAMQWVVMEWKTENTTTAKFKGTIRELLRIDFLGPIHGIQEVAFNPTAKVNSSDYGMLYISIGDGGSVVNGYPEVALHKGTQVWGTILRIDPFGNNSDNGNYGIPPDNPFVNLSNEKRKEIWVYGLRNPNRMSWNAKGQMFASDIGHKIVEEVNLIEPGKFYGWPIREGTFVLNPFKNQSLAFPLPKNDADFGVTYPVIQYDHDDGAAISGGFFARAKPFTGKYIFGDIPTGNIFIADLSKTGQRNMEKLGIQINGKPIDFSILTKSNRVDLRLGQDCNGNIYMFTKADGKIYKMVQE